MHQHFIEGWVQKEKVPVLIRVGKNRKKLCGYSQTCPQAKTKSYKKLYHYLDFKISKTKKKRVD
jgi:hypothetical protein